MSILEGLSAPNAIPAQPNPRSQPQPPDRPGPLSRIASFSFHHHWAVLAAWVLAVVLAVGTNLAVGGEFEADYTVKGSDSQAAQDLLTQRFPQQAGDTIDVVVSAPQGVTGARPAISALLARIGAVPHVESVDDPFTVPGSISGDGTILLTTARLDVTNPVDMPTADADQVVRIAEAASRGGLQVAVGGQTIDPGGSGGANSELIGIGVAAIVLLVALGSVVAAGLPILVALLALGVSASLVAVFAAVTDVPDWSTSLAAMMGIGVGIDYALLLLIRYREQLTAGKSRLEAIIASVETAGRSVLVAGSTVVISLLGLFAMGLSYMRGAALVTIVAVLLVMAAAVTALPAALGALGSKVDALRIPRRRTTKRRTTTLGVRWAAGVQRRPVLAALGGTLLLLVLAAPITGIRFGFPDAGNDPSGSTTRVAYDLTERGFGAGANGPLLIAAAINSPAESAAFTRLSTQLTSTPGVASVSPAQLNDAGDAGVLVVTPTTGPQDSRTEDLVDRIRDQVPGNVHVGGVTATSIDGTADVAGRLPLLVIGVVGLSMLLLLVAFRSITIALKAAVLNVLSIAAAYGVVSYILEGGWAGQLFGIDSPTPLPAFIPVLMFAILFGLSMDYEVFLLSRMRETWVTTGDNARAVRDGLAGTSRVITAAAAIMVAVFAAFVPSPEIFLTIIGIGLAAAILIDAVIVRLVLVPAVMQLLGRHTWWMPRRLERLVPHFAIEGREEFHVPAQT